jgi:cell division protein ZapA (FtsZ GTPase activity inhibitor)
LPQADWGLRGRAGERKEDNVLEKYSIKVNILNRPYPLLVKSEEEEAVRNAAKLINDRIKAYKDRFSVQDDLDLVIMCCLELATDNLNQSLRLRTGIRSVNDSIDSIDEVLNAAILNLEEVSTSVQAS